MPAFTVNTTRRDPYKNFKFLVRFEGRVVAGISKVSPLKRTVEVIVHRQGGDPNAAPSSPGQTKFEAITLERGVTHDVEFLQWANKVWNFGAQPGGESSLADFRRDITLDLLNEAGQVAKSWRVYGCWVSEYQAVGELDANGNAVAIETIKMENQGFEPDEGTTEPTEPTFTNPD